MFTDRRKGFWIEEATLSPSAQIPPHVHRDVYELNWTKRGRGVRTLGGSTEPFACDDVVLTPPGVRHFWDFRPWRRKFCTHCVFVRTRWIDALRKAIPSFDADLAPLLRAPVSLVARGRLRTQARQAVAALDGLGETEQALGVVRLLLLFAHATAESERISHPATLSPDERAREDLRLYCVCNYTRSIRLDDAAKEFGKSRSGFCEHVKRLTGKTLVECLTETRIEKACELLETTAQSVAEVAARVGFEDAAYFSRVFARERKMSPLAWRRKGAKTVAPYRRSRGITTARARSASGTRQARA